MSNAAAREQAMTEMVVKPLRDTGRNPEDYDLDGILDSITQQVEGIYGEIVDDPDEFWQIVEDHKITAPGR